MPVRKALLRRLKYMLRLSRSRFFPLCVLLLLVLLAVSCGPNLEITLPPDFAPGISYTNYRSPKVPWSVHVVRLSRSHRELEIHASHASWSALGLSTLSRQIKTLPPELGAPLAGVNGDYHIRDRAYAGDPRGLQIMNGELISAPNGGVSFWLDADVQPHATNVMSLFKLTWPNGIISSFGLNEDRRSNNVMVLYTPAIGASTKTVRGRELVLEREGDSPWLPLQAGQAYRARVREVYEHGDTCLTPDTMVLSLKPNTTNKLPVAQVGDILTLTMDTWPNLAGVKTAISGGPMLVIGRRRQEMAKPDLGGPLPYSLRSMRERHPRAGLGWNEKYIFLAQVDGRQEKLSVGMSLPELADYMIRLGCREVINLDGGGSAMFWFNGRIVNSPCDKRERDIANALVVVRKGVRLPVVTAAVENTNAGAPNAAGGPQ